MIGLKLVRCRDVLTSPISVLKMVSFRRILLRIAMCVSIDQSQTTAPAGNYGSLLLLHMLDATRSMMSIKHAETLRNDMLFAVFKDLPPYCLLSLHLLGKMTILENVLVIVIDNQKRFNLHVKQNGLQETRKPMIMAVNTLLI
jgi:hypothetical protein